MGKAAGAGQMKKKKKGRPSLSDLQTRTLKQQQQPHLSPSPNPNSSPIFHKSTSRSTPRNPNNVDDLSPAPDWIDAAAAAADDDDDDERKQKKVKLVVRLPNTDEHYHQPGSSANSSFINSVSNDSYDGENNDDSAKKLKINTVGDRSLDVTPNQGEDVSKTMDALYGSPLGSGPTIPLPDKKLLVFILDRLQKKDTYGVFSEPVDANELPDYHEIIEHPMDFGTVRRKLDEGRYSNLDEFEADVLLICSNAMEYNAPDTIYFRQARSIQELAKRDFENLKQVSDDGEPRPKVVRRGRPPSKNIKKPLGRPPLDRAGSEQSPDAMPSTGGGDNAIGSSSSSYNLRRAPPVPLRFQHTNAFARALSQSQNNETYTNNCSQEWNTEFPASILKAEAKYGKKQFSFDENRRATYKKIPPSLGNESSLLTTLNGDSKQIAGVGLYAEQGYARSLARFAANLGPVVWQIASRKIESVLPPGFKYGPGWVEEDVTSSEKQKSVDNSANEAHPSSRPVTPASSLNSGPTYRHPMTASEPDMVEVASGLVDSRPEMIFQNRQKSVIQPDRNGINSVFGPGLSSPQMGMFRQALPMQHSGKLGFEEASAPYQMLNNSGKLGFEEASAPYQMLNNNNNAAVASSCSLAEESKAGKLVAPHNWQSSSLSSVPPDLNIRFQTSGSSPSSSSYQIGSPHPPDLALQL